MQLAGQGYSEFIMQVVGSLDVETTNPASISLWCTVIIASHFLHIGKFSNEGLVM